MTFIPPNTEKYCDIKCDYILLLFVNGMYKINKITLIKKF